MISNLNNFLPLPDCHLSEWLSKERINNLDLALSKSLHLISNANVLDEVLRSWSEIELLKDLRTSDVSITELESNNLCFDDLENDPIVFSTYRTALIETWSSLHWKNKLESMYLSKQTVLEKLSFSMINVESMGLACEIYYRIKAEEQSFNQLYFEYDIHRDTGPRNGYYKGKSIKIFPEKMHPFLRRLQSKDLLKPFMNGKHYSVLLMDTWHAAVFDQSTKKLLLYEEFLEWQSLLVDQLKKHLLLTD